MNSDLECLGPLSPNKNFKRSRSLSPVKSQTTSGFQLEDILQVSFILQKVEK